MYNVHKVDDIIIMIVNYNTTKYPPIIAYIIWTTVILIQNGLSSYVKILIISAHI